MLYLSADATGDVELGVNGDTGLTNLAVVVGLACIHGGATSSYLSVQLLSQFKQHVESFA